MRQNHIFRLAALVVCVALVAGCFEKDKRVLPPPPEQLPPPIHPSAEEIADEIAVGLAPLDEVVTFETGITPELRDQLIEYLDNARRTHSATEWGRQGLVLTANRLEDRLEDAKANMFTDVALFLCDLIETIEPENTKVPRYREWAKIQLERPLVKIVGWFEFEEPRFGKDEIYVLLEVYVPATGKTERPKVMEGEEFMNLKFHRIIGKKRGIVLEYLPTKDRFAVYGPGRRAAMKNADPNT